MKSLALLSAVVALSLSLAAGDAEAARRLGGGSSSGMQRQSVQPQKSAPTAAPAQNQATAPAQSPAAAAAPQAQPKRSWMGPIAGLAAGLGLAALASHFGFGDELASMLMIGLLIMVALAVVGFIMKRRAAAAAGPKPAFAGASGMQYSSTGQDYGRSQQPEYSPQPAAFSGQSLAPAAAGAAAGNIPADFDVAGFVRNAKVNFIRLQAANDAGNLDDIREFTTPEMFGEIKLAMAERGQSSQETDVVQVDAEVLDVADEASRYVVTVRFHGLIREDRNAATEPFDEMWHMVKPKDGSRGWVLAGIQQVQ